MAIIQGEARFAKLIKPVPTFDKTEREYTFDLVVDKAAIKKLTELECAGQIKTNKQGEQFIKFSRKTTKRDPANPDGPKIPAKPYEIVDRKGQPWDGRLIGNGSILNVMVIVNDKFGGGKKANAIKVQVWDLVEYEGAEREDFPVDEEGKEAWA